MAAGLLALAPVISSLLSGAMDLFDGDKKRQAELILKELDQEQIARTEQAAINRVEAAHSSLFVSGWRPAVGWVCALGLVYEFCVRPMTAWAAGIWWPGTPLPPSIGDVLLELLLALLGLGTLRTAEKWRGVARG